MMLLLPILMAVRAAEDDTNLVARMQRRDPNALAELYDRYGRVVYSLILRVVRDVGIAEDLVQESFLRVWNRVHGFDAQKGSIGPWLLAVARNRAIDYLRSAGGRTASGGFDACAPAMFLGDSLRPWVCHQGELPIHHRSSAALHGIGQFGYCDRCNGSSCFD